MDVAVGAMKHESNTFTRESTPLEAFDPVTGDAVYRSSWMADETATAGIVETLTEAGHTIVPTQFGSTLPSGTATADAFRQLRDGIVAGVRASDPDAICLDLHGSMYAEGQPDPEGALLERLREVVGQRTPIVTSLDMHATVSERMTDALDGVSAYRTAPHTDVFDSGVRAATTLLEILDGHPTTVHRVRVPVIVSGERSETDTQPMRGLIESSRALEEREGIVQAALLLGFPWADSPYGGSYVVLTGRAEATDDTRRAAVELAETFWRRRDEFAFTTETYSLERAIDVAEATEGRPVVVSDLGDNPTAGATQDVTAVDEYLRERSIESALVAVVADAGARAACAEVGEGGLITLRLGHTGQEPDSPPHSVEATVETLGEVGGIHAAVVCADDVTTVITAERTAVSDPEFLRELGVEPTDYQIVAIKSGYQSPAYQALATHSVFALTPGDTNPLLEELPYERVPRPIRPLDEDFEWSPR